VLADRHHQRLLQILTSSHASSNNPLFPFDHMSGGALLPIFDVPRLTMPPPPPPPPPQQQQLSSIEDWLFDESGGALLPIFDVPRLTMPLPPPPQQQLSSIEDWLFDEAAKQVIERKPV
jgi:hypothetical protein